MRKGNDILINILWVFSLALTACANIAIPSGGSQDYRPPQYLKSDPVNNAVSFADNRLEISFNEFISLDDPGGQILISPPLEKFPDIKTRGKNLILHFKEPLVPETSYTIDFGNSIKDITEGNIMTGFRFVFSTGPVLDSFSIQGSVADAFSLASEKEIMILLYKNPYDSIPYKEKPDYIARTNSSGLYTFSNVAPGNYMIFALKDVNANLLFDIPTERIAFSDSLVVSQYIPQPDTAKADTNAIDTTTFVLKQYPLFLFDEVDTTQRLLKSRSDHPGLLTLIFRWPVKDITYKFIHKPLADGWCMEEKGRRGDTLNCWVKDLGVDSLYFEVYDQEILIDTVSLGMKKVEDSLQKPKRGSGKGVSEKDFPFKLLMSSNASPNRNFDINQKLGIEFLHPVTSYDLGKVFLYEKKDSIGKVLLPDISFEDSLIKRHLIMDYDWKGKTKYELLILPGAFTDIYGLQNDSLQIRFMTTDLEDYGVLKLLVNISEDPAPYIFQLLNDAKNVISERELDTDGELIFDFLRTGNYSARIIIDRNRNGKWDSGRYLQKIQPEKVYNYPGTINVKANWDTEIDWNM